ncbi:MAG: PQQ-binding-like beta-propeller repeat protein [Kiritimatiellaeota bacterium]|nr:PQQ-binding-like beta-propeller repeat protein [Kiritimatiellota bacterium]
MIHLRTQPGNSWRQTVVLVAFLVACPVGTECAAVGGAEQDAATVLEQSGFSGGLVVHVGCGDANVLRRIATGNGVLAQGLMTDADALGKVRSRLLDEGLYGRVSLRLWQPPYLPYIDNLVNLLIVERPDSVPKAELLRVLAPNGKACVRRGRKWETIVKPRPGAIDEWTHYLHDATGNPVAQDDVVAPPEHLQWVGAPRWSRHHDRMASMSALVSTGGRIFYIMDEGSRAIIQLPPKWKLIARDAFNGTTLWKRDIPEWHFHLWAMKSGPADLTRRLVAIDDRVYVTLGIRAPISVLDAATGKTLAVYAQTRGAEELIVSDGVLFAVVNPNARPDPDPFVPDRSGVWNDTRTLSRTRGWDEKPRLLTAIDLRSGKVLWRYETPVAPMTPAADGARLYFHDGKSVLALDRKSGKRLWRSTPVSRKRYIPRRFGPNLIIYKDTVLFTGGDRRMWGLDAAAGTVLWTAHHPPSGHCSQEDLMVVGGLVWAGDIADGKRSGVWKGRDPRTGVVKNEFAPDVETYWFHHRCYRSKATMNYLLPSRTGIEFVDFRKQHWQINHWIRGGCIYGIMPCNGLIYAPPHSCACYLESKLRGFNAVAAGKARRPVDRELTRQARLLKGPAFDAVADRAVASTDWPTYRHDAARSGSASAEIEPAVAPGWRTELGGRLTSPVVAGGTVFVAAVDAHTLYALNQDDGSMRWRFTVNGRIDSPPTVVGGRVIFGSADGRVTALRATDGALCWQLRAAPVDRALSAFGQLESPWPVHGSVMVRNGVVYFVAGRAAFLDGGMKLFRVKATTGEVLSETVLDGKVPGGDEDLQSLTRVLNMPVALPDVLSTDGRYVYMRSQPFKLDGTYELPVPQPTDPIALADAQQGDDRHLFCPTGYLDGTWFHRAYWLFGRRYSSGCNWWARAGQNTPAGRILTFDARRVFGFGRGPKYFTWAVPLEYHLFAADRNPPVKPNRPPPPAGGIGVAGGPSLDPKGKPLTVSAWIRPDSGNGVIIARGGASHGYGLMLKDGRAAFALRINGKLQQIEGGRVRPRQWQHVAGVLGTDKSMHLYLDGAEAATGKSAGFIAATPNEAMQIGVDAGSPVGDYKRSTPLKGLIDEVRIYHRALAKNEVAALAKSASTASRQGLVLYYSFNAGDALDESGNGNHGGVGAVPAAGKWGRGMALGTPPVDRRGRVRLRRQVKFAYRWSRPSPIFVRAMVNTTKALFVAGPRDVIDEEDTYRRLRDPDVKQMLAEQEAIMSGKRGALLLAIAPDTGRELHRIELSSPPVWDGMAGAAGALYISTLDGAVTCIR